MYCFDCSPQGSTNSITILRRKAKEIGVQKLGGQCKKCRRIESISFRFSS